MASRLKQIPESLLARLWRERAARQGALRAGNGRRFRVIYPGRPGTTAGPDFRDAVLEEEGVGLIRGDVEVHVRQRDWQAHGHGTDPRYNGVVLHVVARVDEEYSTLHSGSRVPVLSLEPLLNGQTSFGAGIDPWILLRAHGYARPCSAAELGILLDTAGDRRFMGNSDAFLALLGREDPQQVLYAALMEAMGYSQNRRPFLELADRVPYRRLESVARKAPPEERLHAIQQVLLGAAGFRPPSRGARAIGNGRWYTFRVRPQNHPQRRIEGFAHLLDQVLPQSAPCDPGPVQSPSPPPSPTDGHRCLPPWAMTGLSEGMAYLVRSSRDAGGRGGPWRDLELALTGSGQPPSGTCGADRRRTVIGRGRARDMAVNCVLPYVHALGRRTGDSQLSQSSLELYRRFPRLQENEVTREMGSILLSQLPRGDSTDGGETYPKGIGSAYVEGQHSVVRGMGWESIVCNARRQQGLHHLHHLLISLGTSPA